MCDAIADFIARDWTLVAKAEADADDADAGHVLLKPNQINLLCAWYLVTYMVTAAVAAAAAAV